MDGWNKKLTAFWVFVVVFASVTAFYSGVVCDSQEEQMSGYKEGFIDGLDYQRIYLETSGRTAFYANVTEVVERIGYDEFGRYHFISDIAKEDGLKVANESGFYYKPQYRILVKEPQKHHYLNHSGGYTLTEKEEYDRSIANNWCNATLSPPYIICNSDWECVEVREDKEGNIHFSSGWFDFEYAGWHNIRVVENKGVYIDGELAFPY